MTEAIVERVQRYLLDGDDADLRRLLGVAQGTREMARSAFRRIGVQPGWTAVGGPFDLAYTRLFLMHQTDPASTLRRIANLLRPGGWVVAQEALRRPPPRSHPDLDALGTYWEILYETIERGARVPRDAVEDLAGSARSAGLEVVDDNGCFQSLAPAFGFELHAATLAAVGERAVESGVASEPQIDALVNELRAAKNGGYEWVSSPFFRDLALRKTV